MENVVKKIPSDLVKNAHEERTLNWLVSISAAIVIILFAVFFVLIIQNVSIISNKVQYVKDGPYPISVAAGHIETNLVSLETVIEYQASTQLEGGVSRDPAFNKSFGGIIGGIRQQMDSVDKGMLDVPGVVDSFSRQLDLLESRLAAFTNMRQSSEEGSSADHTELVTYAENYLYPIISYMLWLNDRILQETTYEVDEMYEAVNTSIGTMLVFSIVMLVSVVVMIVIYMVLLRIKSRFENELRVSLTHALDEAREANEAKSMFLSNMSHDIRTPMNAIIGLTAIANENINDKMYVRQCLTRISTSSQHLLSLINDVLDMNKIESGKVTLAEEEFSLVDLVNEIEMIIQSQPTSHRLNSRVRMVNIKNDLLLGDTMRLRQILLNLTSNAIKYTNEGDDMLFEVRENELSRPGWASVTFVVEDTGIGMKSDFVKHIFEPFERERNDFTIFTEGTGLGMAITKNIVDLMNGTIRVDSELGIGTKVTIDLDFKIASERSKHRTKAVREGTFPKAVHDGKVKGSVLIVEDNEINMEIAKTLISDRGANVVGASDGLEAVMMIESAEEGSFDLIFMDWQMPHMNGIEATKAIRRYFDEHGWKQIPIVAMTANAFDSDREEALGAGMDDFMAKPIDINQLDETLHKYLSEAKEDDADGNTSEGSSVSVNEDTDAVVSEGRGESA